MRIIELHCTSRFPLFLTDNFLTFPYSSIKNQRKKNKNKKWLNFQYFWLNSGFPSLLKNPRLFPTWKIHSHSSRYENHDTYGIMVCNCSSNERTYIVGVVVTCHVDLLLMVVHFYCTNSWMVKLGLRCVVPLL